MTDNEYFVMSHMYGVRPDGLGGPFNVIAIKLWHGKAISWDGRLIRHCTSVTRPDGREGSHAADGGKQTINHVHGTFTAAKEQIVHAGRKRAAPTLLRETNELANDGNEIDFYVEDEREELAPYNPTIEETDPDNDPVPKEDGDWDWHCAMKKRELNDKRKLESEKQGGNKPANLPAPDRMQTPQPTAMVDVPTSALWES